MPSQVNAAITYPLSEPSILTFDDLVREVAYKIGCASYGSTGTGAPAAPTDPHDLTLCKRIVNKAIRMFIHDGPQPNGWHWLNPIAQVDLWPQINIDTTGSTYVMSTGYDSTTNLTTLTLTTPPLQASTSTTAVQQFYPSMELRDVWLGGNPPSTSPGWNQPLNQTFPSTVGNPFVVVNYLSPSQVQVFGQLPSTLASTSISTSTSASTLPSTWHIPFAFSCTGDYTMPANFGGSYTGEISYVANTNRGMILRWTDESSIRGRRQNANIESGTPYEAAVRLIPTPQYLALNQTAGSTLLFPRWRWELITWRIASEFLHVIFPYTLQFQDLVSSTDLSPAPFSHDETLKAACLAVAEKEVEDAPGVDWQYYRGVCLPNSYRIDAMSMPKALGYFGNPSARNSMGPGIKNFRGYWYQRPIVPVY